MRSHTHNIHVAPYPSRATTRATNCHHPIVPPAPSLNGRMYPTGPQRTASSLVGTIANIPAVKNRRQEARGGSHASWDVAPAGRSVPHHQQDNGYSARVRDSSGRESSRDFGTGRSADIGCIPVPASDQTPMTTLPLPCVLNTTQHGRANQLLQESHGNERPSSRGASECGYSHTIRGTYASTSTPVGQFQHQEKRRDYPQNAGQHHPQAQLDPSTSGGHRCRSSRFVTPLPPQPRGTSPVIPVYQSLDEAIRQHHQIQQKHLQKQKQHHVHQAQVGRHPHSHHPHQQQLVYSEQAGVSHHSHGQPSVSNSVRDQESQYHVRHDAGGQEPFTSADSHRGHGQQLYPRRGQGHERSSPVVREEQMLPMSRGIPGDGNQTRVPKTYAPETPVTSRQNEFTSGAVSVPRPQQRIAPPPLQVTAPTPPLHVLPISVSGNGASTSITPVLTYAYPRGYIMAYPQGLKSQSSGQQASLPVQTQRSQEIQSWDPYECISPEHIASQQRGFGRVRKGRAEKTPAPSRDGSPPKQAPTRDSSPQKSPKGSINHHSTQIASSTISDLIDRGFNSSEQRSSRPHGKNVSNPYDKEAQPHIPIRDKDAPVCEGDKENNDTSAGAMRKGQKTPGRTIQEPLSGRKRGGEQIARQKLFTGSYFQVSPRSFLHRSKKRRGGV